MSQQRDDFRLEFSGDFQEFHGFFFRAVEGFHERAGGFGFAFCPSFHFALSSALDQTLVSGFFLPIFFCVFFVPLELEHIDDLLAVFHEEICEDACLVAVGDGFCDGGVIIVSLAFVFLDAVDEIAVAIERFAGLQDGIRFVIRNVDDVDAELKVAIRFFKGIGQQELVTLLFFVADHCRACRILVWES